MPAAPHPAGLVLVTGASGFVGSAIAAAFRASGMPVRTLVRTTSVRTNIDPHDEVAVGDLLDRASMAAALKNVRYLVHAAADYRLWAPSPDEIERANVEGTRIVMQEALRAGVERIVYTSSVATFDLRGRRPCRRDPAPAGHRSGRRLQAQQDHRRGSGRRNGRPRRAARRDRQSLDADRTARRQADADRSHHHRSRLAAGCRRSSRPA